MDIPILQPNHQWACPNCSNRDVTTEARPHQRMHACAGMSGLTAPMLPAAEVDNRRVKVETKVREDYVGKETGLSHDENGQPIMAVETKYADGRTDVAVYAPTATAKVS